MILKDRDGRIEKPLDCKSELIVFLSHLVDLGKIIWSPQADFFVIYGKSKNVISSLLPLCVRIKWDGELLVKTTSCRKESDTSKHVLIETRCRTTDLDNILSFVW